MKKPALIMASALAVLALASCVTDPDSSSPSVSEGSSSSSAATPTRYVTFTLERDSIPEGATFFDGCRPTVKYTDRGVTTDYTYVPNYITFTITDQDGKTYGAGDALPAGTYNCNAFVIQRDADVTFTVYETTPETASEGKGYKSYWHEDLAGTEVSKHAAIGSLGVGKFPAYGTPKMLVIPVIFKDMEQGNSFTESELADIEAAFFGDSEETGWESLKSYYYKSSYGLLDIQGHVGEPYVSTYTVAEADRIGVKASAEICYQAAQDYFQRTGESPTDYDYDKDGWIDGVNLIYKTTKANTSENPNASDIWWNYTTTIDQHRNVSADVNDPDPNRFFWSEYDMMKKSYYNPPIDAHTIIHENGHQMGLNDYYSYDESSTGGNSEGVAGCVDMMDMNVGDHNGYSKMLFNWLAEDEEANGVHLKVVDGSSDDFTITLESFTDTGDLLLVRNTTEDPWNETPYDEYLILQYYTPTGVNAKDSTGYPEWSQQENFNAHGGTYKYPGLQVFHVDARLGTQVTENGVAHWEYTDEIRDQAETIEGVTYGASEFLTDNTGSRSERITLDGKKVAGAPYREISAILAGGTDSLYGNAQYYNLFGEMTNLFGSEEFADEMSMPERERYGGSTYSTYKMRDFYKNPDTIDPETGLERKGMFFNDGTSLNWTFSVVDQTESTITLHFVNNDAYGA